MDCCDTCIHSGIPTYKSPCGNCYGLPGAPMCKYERREAPPTRADRIRAMSDEELARWLARSQVIHCRATLAVFGLKFDDEENMLEEATQEYLQRLKMPADQPKGD